MKHRTLTPDMGAYPSWPLRLAAFRTGDWLGECLLSIRKDAQKAGDEDVYNAAQYALDTGGDLSELDAIFAAEAEAERLGSIIYRYETRTGREWEGAL